jgi:hypothetical protein
VAKELHAKHTNGKAPDRDQSDKSGNLVRGENM